MTQKQVLIGTVVVAVAAVLLWSFQTPSESSDQVCEVANCHGLDVVCGSEPAEVCTEEYVVGDFCRQFASCQVTNGNCVTVTSETYDRCRSCVEDCLDQYEQNESFDVLACDDRCRQQISEE